MKHHGAEPALQCGGNLGQLWDKFSDQGGTNVHAVSGYGSIVLWKQTSSVGEGG